MVAVHPAQPQGSALTEIIHARPLEATLHGDASIAGRQGNCWAYSHVRRWHQHRFTDFYNWLSAAKCSQRQKQCGGEVDVNSIVFFYCCDRTLALMLMLVVCVSGCASVDGKVVAKRGNSPLTNAEALVKHFWGRCAPGFTFECG